MKALALVMVLSACGGVVTAGDDAPQGGQLAPPALSVGAPASDDAAAPLPLPLRCAELAGQECDPATFPPACCVTADDAGAELHACESGEVTITPTCDP